MSQQMELTSGATLAALRRRCDLTQVQLAERAGCTKQFINKLERGGSRSCSERLASAIKAALTEALQEALHLVAQSLFVPREFPDGKVIVASEER